MFLHLEILSSLTVFRISCFPWKCFCLLPPCRISYGKKPQSILSELFNTTYEMLVESFSKIISLQWVLEFCQWKPSMKTSFWHSPNMLLIKKVNLQLIIHLQIQIIFDLSAINNTTENCRSSRIIYSIYENILFHKTSSIIQFCGYCILPICIHTTLVIWAS